MKKIWIMLLLATVSLHAKTQNIVPNGDFEQYDTCPNMLNQLHLATGWMNWCASPDYFNACAPIGTVSVPYNLGLNNFQYAHSGNAYAGFFNYWTRAFLNGYPWIRDQVAIQLIHPLQTGVKYYLTMYVCLASWAPTPCASSKIGVKFTTQSFASNANGFASSLVDNTAPIYVDSMLTDTANWVKVTGSFVADSAYEYLVIGNFFDDLNTDTLIMGSIPYCYSYYLVDDVCLSSDSVSCLAVGIPELSGNGQPVLYPNPVSDVATIKLPVDWIGVKLTLYDLLGRNVALKYETLGDQNRLIILTKDLKDGMYYLNLFHDGQIKTIKLIINN